MVEAAVAHHAGIGGQPIRLGIRWGIRLSAGAGNGLAQADQRVAPQIPCPDAVRLRFPSVVNPHVVPVIDAFDFVAV
ncbi:hypothetical protein [Cupriavidus sp. USMAHM13]|uniref:hypothetical protein n=1 Tax=Cupriavidus sp. USMAHM13 TaxID=1389192 RepID=UPI0012EA9FE1|nr:hypothetical protein [Cupriavidus sp. USMAHM13]